MLVCISIHADTSLLCFSSSYNTQENELLRAYCSDYCSFGQRETNAAGISGMYSICSIYGVSEADLFYVQYIRLCGFIPPLPTLA